MKYMVLVPNDSPEYVEADSYRVDDLRVLHLYTGDRESASFVNWLGIKEVAPSPVAVQFATTTTNPARTKVVRQYR